MAIHYHHHNPTWRACGVDRHSSWHRLLQQSPAEGRLCRAPDDYEGQDEENGKDGEDGDSNGDYEKPTRRAGESSGAFWIGGDGSGFGILGSQEKTLLQPGDDDHDNDDDEVGGDDDRDDNGLIDDNNDDN